MLRMNVSRFTEGAVLPVIAVLFALGIFIVDTFTPLGIAVAALYVAVILLAGLFLSRRGVILVATACIALTIVSYLIQHWGTYGGALIRCIVSLVAIIVTTFLALKGQTASLKLREQAGLLEITHDAVIVRDLEDRISYWNRGAEELYGWPREEAIGKRSRELLQTEYPADRATLHDALFSADRLEVELVNTKSDGTRVAVASRWSVQRDAAGRPVAILETNNDISKRKEAQDALQRAQTELTHVSRVTTLGELTASIAHEVNQPLAAVVTNGEAGLRWLKLQPPQIEEARSVLERIIADGHRASEVIKRLRELARKSDPKMAPLDINDAIKDVAGLVQGELQRHNVRLRLDLNDRLRLAVGDRVQLQQVLLNLMMNGVEAMASSDTSLRELVVRSLPQEDGRVQVAVQDTGVGLDPDLDNLFQAFYTTKPNGMGMGLSICRSIIEAHDGELWASPNKGMGATFHFTIPLHRETET
jgi:two-component system sensor kinase FixL